MSIKRTKLAEKKPTIKLKRAAEKEREIHKLAAVAVAAFHQLASVENEDRILPPNFRIFQTLGTGAMGTVYRVIDENTGQELAAKVLNPQWHSDSIALKRFEIEAAAAGELNHPNIAQVYSCHADNKSAFLLMEYVDGPSLSQVLQRDRVIETGKMVNLLLQICDALEYAHARGVVHRDLKPSNIIVRELPAGNVAKLVDFGIAKVAPANKSATQLTQMGQVFGTPSYMSPEQAHGSNTDHRSDLYALGCILYEALAGKQLFPGENGIHVMLQHINVSPQKTTRALLQKGYSKSLVAVLEKLLEKKPERRYQSATELADDLQRIVQKRPSKAYLRNPLMINVSRNTVIACAAGVTLLSAIAVTGCAISGNSSHPGYGALSASERLRSEQNEEKQLIAKLAGNDIQDVTFAANALVNLTGANGFLQNSRARNGYFTYGGGRIEELVSQDDQKIIIGAYNRFSDPLLREKLIAILGTAIKPTQASLNLVASICEEPISSPGRSVAIWVLKDYARTLTFAQQSWLSTVISKILLATPEEVQVVSQMAGNLQNFSDEAINNFRKSAKTITAANLKVPNSFGQFHKHPLITISHLRHEYYPELLIMAHGLSSPNPAWSALAQLGPKASPAIPTLCRMLENGDQEVEASRALATIGPIAAPEAVPLLKKILYSPPSDELTPATQAESVHYFRQDEAAAALARMGPSGEAVLREASHLKTKQGEIAGLSLRNLRKDRDFPRADAAADSEP